MRKFYYSLLAVLGLAGTAAAVTAYADSADYTVVGTYTLNVTPVDVMGTKSPAVDMKVEVRQNGTDYCIAEVGGTDYLKSYEIPFTYNSASKMANFTGTYLGYSNEASFSDYPYLWSAAIDGDNSPIEYQPSYGCSFTAADGFSFDSGMGFAIFGSDSQTECTPYNSLVAFIVNSCISDAAGSDDNNGATYSGSVTGTYDQENNGATTTYSYTLNYAITYNADQTLSVTGAFNWADGNAPVGATGMGVLVSGVTGDFTNNNGVYTDSHTFTKDQEITVQFYQAVAGGRAEVNVPYTVGSSNAAAGGFADASIVGEWSFTLNDHYAGDWSLGEITTTFVATLDGNTVTFESSDSNDHIVAVFTAENTLTFSQTAVTDLGTYPRTQFPFIDGSKVTDVGIDGDQFDFANFTATYNPEAGTITFTQGTGLAYGPSNAATTGGYETAYDLISAKQAGNDPADGNYANPAIVGNWNFTLDGHYLGEYSKGQFTEEFAATLDGNTVTFASSGSQFNIVAEFTAVNTLTFKECMVGPEATYTLWQSPYINSDGTDDLEDLEAETFTATYYPDSNTIVFPEHSGLRYGYFDKDGKLSYWDDAFDFVTAGFVGNEDEEFEPNKAIEGEWTFTLDGHYAGNESLGEFSEVFNATLEGNIVTFETEASMFNIVAEFTAANTLTFKQCAVFGLEATYPLYQSPYINTGNVTVIGDLNETEFSATFDPATNSLIFPANSGLRYGRYTADSTDALNWVDAFDFVNAVKNVDALEGTYTWTILPTDVTGATDGQSVDITVAVKNVGEGAYTLSEEGNTNYFNDQVIPFTYNENSGLAQFTANYAGEMGGEPVWFSAFVYNDGMGQASFIEPQENFGVQFSVENGFKFPGNSGFGWFVTSSAEDFDSMSVYSAFYVLNGGTSAVGSVDVDAEGEAVYFDLQGRRVNNPQNGIFIKLQGTKAQKVVINN